MRKLLSLLLAVLMTATLFTVPAFAAGEYVADADMDTTVWTGFQGDQTWLVNIDPAAADTSAIAGTKQESGSNFAISGSNGATKQAAVYVLTLPAVPEGKMNETAEFRVSSWASTATAIDHSYKMPGVEDMSKITIGDMQKFIPGNKLGGGEHYLAPVKTGDAYYSGNVYRNRYDITGYINECIAAGQKKICIALAHGYTVKAYRHNQSNKAKIYYTLTDAPVVKDAKVVSADSQADYDAAADIAPAKGQSIKAISYMANITDADVNLMVGVAQYKGEELISLSFVPYKLSAGAEASTVSFGNVTVDVNADKVKAIIWDASYNPVTDAKTLEVK